MMGQADLQDLEAVAAECRAAAETILANLEAVLAQAATLGDAAPVAAAAIEAAALRAMEVCAFQDRVGQRLARVLGGRSDDPLLTGPQDADAALSQDSIDALFG